MVGLASYLPSERQIEALREALLTTQKIEDMEIRKHILTKLTPKLVKYLDKTALYSLWRETLHFLAYRTRLDLLSDLRAMENVMIHLGGIGMINGFFNAVRDAGREWP